MAEENNNLPNKSGEDSGNGQPPVNDEGKSEKPQIDPAEQARRDQQSKKDKAVDEADELRDQVDFLTSREAERARDAYINDFLTTNAEKYPNVTSEDLKFADSKEGIEELANHLENKFKDLQQKALSSVQEEAITPLTDEEIAERNKELEKQVAETGQSKFSGFIENIQRRKR